MTKPEKLFNKNFILIWQGQFVSRIGAHLFTMAMVLWIKNTTGSASLIGTITAISGFLGLILGPISGTFADRASRKWIIVFTDLVQGLTVTAFAVYVFMFPQNVTIIVILLFVISIIGAVSSSFFGPAISASIPDIVPKKSLASANSLWQFAEQISLFIGSGLGGLIFKLVGGPILFLFDGISYLFSAISELFIKIPQKLPEKDENGEKVMKSFFTDLKEGLNYIWANKGLKFVLYASAAMTFFGAPIIVLIPFFVQDFLLAGDEWVGYLSAALGVGVTLGYFLPGLLKVSKTNRARVIVFSMIGQAFMYGAIGLARNPFAASGIAFAGGILQGYTMVNITLILQITTPTEIRGRVFGVLGTLNGIFAPIAVGLAGFIADMIDQNIPLIYYVCGASMAFFLIIISFFREYRKFLVYDDQSLTEGDEDTPVDDDELLIQKFEALAPQYHSGLGDGK